MNKEKIKKSLLEQLKLKGANSEFYIDVINDYMSFWETKNELQKDIKVRGVTYKDYSSVGVEMYKNNPSVKDLIAVNKQMMQILKDLTLNTPTVEAGDDDGLI